ncbi:MAG: hypothetical protein AB1Z98_21910 [Nannocystaceae bacterium]
MLDRERSPSDDDRRCTDEGITVVALDRHGLRRALPEHSAPSGRPSHGSSAGSRLPMAVVLLSAAAMTAAWLVS